jgi:hypothetical protein
MEQKLNADQLEVALYIYIGQNIRDQGILREDPFLKRKASVVQFLIDRRIIEERRWYKFDVLKVAYRYMVPLKGILERKLQGKEEELCSELRSIPEALLSFLVFEYLAEDVTFSLKKDWLFDWRDVLLENTTVKGHKKKVFQVLMNHGFCVKTRSYVSTRGGELRDSEYVISAEVRKFLAEIIPQMQFPSSLKDLAIIHWLILEEIEYQNKRIAEITIYEEVLEELVSNIDATRNAVDALLARLNSAIVVEETRRIPGHGWELTVSKNSLTNFIKTDVENQIVRQMLTKKAQVSKEETKEANFLKLVRTLIDRKFAVYTTAAQFGGKEIFKSLPYIERCVIDLTTPLQGEEGLRKFVNDLHQVLEESSRKEILKFRGGDFSTLEEWLEIEIPTEASSFYEDAKSFFQELNRLRNFYSHSVNAKGIFESGLIFSKLIGKYSPEKEDITKTQVILLQKSIRALDNLRRALEIVRQKKLGS